jgi:hypothetical protein
MLSDTLFEITLMLEEAMNNYEYHIEHPELENVLRNLFIILVRLDYNINDKEKILEIVDLMIINFFLKINNK